MISIRLLLDFRAVRVDSRCPYVICKVQNASISSHDFLLGSVSAVRDYCWWFSTLATTTHLSAGSSLRISETQQFRVSFSAFHWSISMQHGRVAGLTKETERLRKTRRMFKASMASNNRDLDLHLLRLRTRRLRTARRSEHWTANDMIARTDDDICARLAVGLHDRELYRRVI